MNRQDDKISDVQAVTEMVDALGNTSEVKGSSKKKVFWNCLLCDGGIDNIG